MKRIRMIASIVMVLGLLIVGSTAPVLAHNPDDGDVANYSGVNLDQPTLTRLAQALELTPDELTSHLQDGESLSEIAEAQKVPAEEVVAAIVAPYASELELRVHYGYITQQQADVLLAEAQDRAFALLEQDLTGTGEYGSYTWEEMEEYCGGMMGSGWGGMMGNGWGGMMGNGWGGMMGNGWGGVMGNGWGGMMGNSWGGMMGTGWDSDYTRDRAQNVTTGNGWGNIMGRFWDGITGTGWSGMTSRGMMGGGMMGGW